MSNQQKNIFHLLFIFFLVIFLLQSNFIFNFLGKTSELFSDFQTSINWLECHYFGGDLFTTDKIDCGAGKQTGALHYGYAFLSIPYNETLGFFYRTYVPYIIIFLFIYLTIKIINPRNKIEIVLLYLALLNPSSMVILERLNLDVLVYIIAILIIYNRIYIVNWFLIIYLTFIKIYPITLLISVLIENKKRSVKKLLLIILFLATVSFVYLYIYKEFYIFMIENVGTNKSGFHFLFSLNSMPKIFNYIFGIKYQILLIVFYTLFIFVSYKFYKKINLTKKFLKSEIYTYDSKLFIIGGYLSLFVFIVTSNWLYKEVFLILLIPYILKIKNKYRDPLFNMLIYIFIVKYLYLFLYAYINFHDGTTYVDEQRIFANKFLLIISLKSIFDFMLMSIIAAILYMKTKIYIKNKY